MSFGAGCETVLTADRATGDVWGITIKLCGRQPPNLEAKIMTDGILGDEQSHDAADCPNERLVMREFANGMTVRELKEMIKDWPETNQYGEDCGVWIETGRNLSTPVTTAGPLNLREDEDGELSADFIAGRHFAFTVPTAGPEGIRIVARLREICDQSLGGVGSWISLCHFKEIDDGKANDNN